MFFFSTDETSFVSSEDEAWRRAGSMTGSTRPLSLPIMQLRGGQIASVEIPREIRFCARAGSPAHVQRTTSTSTLTSTLTAIINHTAGSLSYSCFPIPQFRLPGPYAYTAATPYTPRDRQGSIRADPKAARGKHPPTLAPAAYVISAQGRIIWRSLLGQRW